MSQQAIAAIATVADFLFQFGAPPEITDALTTVLVTVDDGSEEAVEARDGIKGAVAAAQMPHALERAMQDLLDRIVDLHRQEIDRRRGMIAAEWGAKTDLTEAQAVTGAKADFARHMIDAARSNRGTWSGDGLKNAVERAVADLHLFEASNASATTAHEIHRIVFMTREAAQARNEAETE